MVAILPKHAAEAKELIKTSLIISPNEEAAKAEVISPSNKEKT